MHANLRLPPALPFGPIPGEGPLRLAGSEPVAGGAQCTIYAHPAHPGLLFKIMKNKRRVWYKRQFSRAGHMMPVVREIEEYLALNNSSPLDADLVERVVGVAMTDLGMALAVEALRDAAGHLAPTLGTLSRRGAVDAALRQKLDRFLDRVIASDLIAYDIRARNIVYAHDAATGEARFVLVDGIGERRVFPVSALIPGLNRFNKKRRIRRMLADLAAHAGSVAD